MWRVCFDRIQDKKLSEFKRHWLGFLYSYCFFLFPVETWYLTVFSGIKELRIYLQICPFCVYVCLGVYTKQSISQTTYYIKWLNWIHSQPSLQIPGCIIILQMNKRWWDFTVSRWRKKKVTLYKIYNILEIISLFMKR